MPQGGEAWCSLKARFLSGGTTDILDCIILFLWGVLVFQGYHNRLLQTAWLNTIDMYSIILPEARSPNSRFLLMAVKDRVCLMSFSQLRDDWQSQAPLGLLMLCHCIPAPIFPWFCLCLWVFTRPSSYRDTSHIGLGVHLLQYGIILTNYLHNSISKQSHILGYWRLGLPHIILKGHNQPIKGKSFGHCTMSSGIPDFHPQDASSALTDPTVENVSRHSQTPPWGQNHLQLRNTLKGLRQKQKRLNSDSVLVTCAVTLHNLVKLSGLHFFLPISWSCLLLRIKIKCR